MACPANHPHDLTPEDMLSRLAPSIERAAGQRATAKADRRAQFPFMAEMTDLFRAAGMDPRPVYATNAKGEAWGEEPRAHDVVIDGDKIAHLPAFEASWRAFFAKQKEDQKTYRERMHRAIRPEERGITP